MHRKGITYLVTFVLSSVCVYGRVVVKCHELFYEELPFFWGEGWGHGVFDTNLIGWQ